ncbi:MAG: hypothetical protein ACJ76H_01510 [Bacteriovoracaceae bacterium]
MLKIFLMLVLTFPAYAFTKNNNVKSCKDISKGPCYEFKGRARLYQNKYVRIWKKGTNRLYQVSHTTEQAFSDLKHLSMATEINATFDMCFLKPEVPSGFSDICIQSVKNLKTSQMPE